MEMECRVHSVQTSSSATRIEVEIKEEYCNRDKDGRERERQKVNMTAILKHSRDS